MPRYTPAKLCSFSNDLTKQWYVYYSVENPETGQLSRHKVSASINRYKTVRDRKKAASAIITELNRLLKAGWNPYVRTTLQAATLRKALYSMVELKKGTLRQRSWQSYKYAVDSLFKNLALDEIAVTSFTHVMAREYLDELSKQGKAGKTINEAKGMLFTLFQMLLDRELIEKNPFAKLPRAAESSGRNIAYSKQERDRIWEYLDKHNPGLRFFTRVIYFTYIRPIEILRLKVSDINLSDMTITIHGDQSKNRKQMVVVIPTAFQEEVKAFIHGASPSDYFIGSGFKPCRIHQHRNTVSLKFRKVLDELGFDKDHTLYGFKHSGVVSAYQAGIDLYSISRQLRHHSLVITQIYLKSLGLMPNTEFASKMR